LSRREIGRIQDGFGQRKRAIRRPADLTGERTLPITGFQPVVNNREYDVFPQETNLLMVLPPARQDTAPPPLVPITMIVNWTKELKARVPAKPR
jgi:hypothetical protein